MRTFRAAVQGFPKRRDWAIGRQQGQHEEQKRRRQQRGVAVRSKPLRTRLERLNPPDCIEAQVQQPQQRQVAHALHAAQVVERQDQLLGGFGFRGIRNPTSPFWGLGTEAAGQPGLTVRPFKAERPSILDSPALCRLSRSRLDSCWRLGEGGQAGRPPPSWPRREGGQGERGRLLALSHPVIAMMPSWLMMWSFGPAEGQGCCRTADATCR